MKKKSDKKKLYKKCLELAKEIAKIRDNYTCQRCGSKTSIQASHIINEARDHRLSIDIDNIKALCFHCHMGLRHKDPILASKWFNEKFPGRWDRLQKQHIENMSLGTISILWLEERYEELLKSKDKLLKKKSKSV